MRLPFPFAAALHLPEMAADLDLSSLTRMPSVVVTDWGHCCVADVVWCARLRAKPSTSVLFAFDFRSTMDAEMNRWADTCIALLPTDAAEQWWGERPNRVWVTPVVLYNGEDLWVPVPTPPLVWTGGEVELGIRYRLIDVGPHGRYDPAWRGAAAAVSHFERARTPEAFAEVFAKLVEDLPSLEEAELRRAFYWWALRLLEHRGLSAEPLYKVEDLTEGLPRIVERMKQWEKDWHRQGRVEGQREGQQQVLVRLASTKFGSAVARRLEAALAEVADPSRTAAISDLVLEHEMGDDFMAAVRGDTSHRTPVKRD